MVYDLCGLGFSFSESRDFLSVTWNHGSRTVYSGFSANLGVSLQTRAIRNFLLPEFSFQLHRLLFLSAFGHNQRYLARE